MLLCTLVRWEIYSVWYRYGTWCVVPVTLHKLSQYCGPRRLPQTTVRFSKYALYRSAVRFVRFINGPAQWDWIHHSQWSYLKFDDWVQTVDGLCAPLHACQVSSWVAPISSFPPTWKWRPNHDDYGVQLRCEDFSRLKCSIQTTWGWKRQYKYSQSVQLKVAVTADF